jgi:hypothetical protein
VNYTKRTFILFGVLVNTAPRNVLHTTWPRAVLTALGACLIVGVVLLGFAWPSVTASPKNLPVGIVGSDAQVTQVEKAIAEKADGAVKLGVRRSRRRRRRDQEPPRLWGDRARSRSDGRTRDPHLVGGEHRGRAAAAGTRHGPQAQIDAQIRSTVEKNVQKAGRRPAGAAALQKLTIPTVTVVVNDVVPLADSDPRGTGIAAAMFPLTLGGMLGAMVVSFAIKGSWRRLAGLAVYAVGAGLVLTSILQAWFGALQGDFRRTPRPSPCRSPRSRRRSWAQPDRRPRAGARRRLHAADRESAVGRDDAGGVPGDAVGISVRPSRRRRGHPDPHARTSRRGHRHAMDDARDLGGAGLLLIALSGVRRPAPAAAGPSSASSGQPATA